MRALTYQGKRDVRVETVPGPRIQDSTDTIVNITPTGIFGSDLHLYEVPGLYLDPGDILGHEPMGVVEELGSDVTAVAPIDRVVIPFSVFCGHCACESLPRPASTGQRCPARTWGRSAYCSVAATAAMPKAPG